MKRLWIALLVATSLACGSSSSTPAAPSSTPPAAATRIIALNGALGFGTVAVGGRGSAVVTVSNLGNNPLTISGLSGPNADVFSASPVTGVVPAGGTLQITVFCSPKAQVVYSGTVTVASDATSGTNTLPVSCGGSLAGTPLFSASGFGNNVFSLPSYVARVHVTGHFVDTGSNSNFIVTLNGLTLINEILRNANYDGVHLTTGGGTIQITNSGSIQWRFDEVR
jgi:hypothetical protein